MTTYEDATPDEDTDVGIRIRLRQIEQRQRRIETKLDRLLWTIVVAALGYALAIVFGGNGTPIG